MIRALRTAASGMYAQELQLDNTANNLANIETNGYKRSRLNFQDLYYDTIKVSSTLSSEQPIAGRVEIGYGSHAASSSRIFQQGSLVETANPTDIAVMGEGFIQVSLPDGGNAYTRDGALSISSTGSLVTSAGYNIEPQVVVPEEVTNIAITEDGSVWGYVPNQDDPEMLGQITLSRFINPSGLEAQGENLFKTTDTSGEAMSGIPGEDGLGYIRQGFVERSNVSAVEEMVSLMSSQRAYEINSKAIKAADEVLGTVADLRR